jgi:hypothetical protein
MRHITASKTLLVYSSLYVNKMLEVPILKYDVTMSTAYEELTHIRHDLNFNRNFSEGSQCLNGDASVTGDWSLPVRYSDHNFA